MLLILALVFAATEGAVVKRQAYNNSFIPTQFQQFGSNIPQGFTPPPQFGSFIPGGQRAESASPIPIVRLDIQPNLGDGKYSYSYETGNGIVAEEQGSQKAVGDPAEEGTVAVGSYSYTDPDGTPVQLSYTADENGFVPVGSHIPTPPPVPAEILAALEKNAAEEAAANNGAISPAYHVFLRYYRQRYY